MSEGVVLVDIVHPETKIGDTLCVLPLIVQLAESCATEVHVRGAFAEPVKALVGRLPICFDPPEEEPVIDIRVEIQKAYEQGRARDQHMAVSICRLAGMRLPLLPVTLDLAVCSLGLPPGIVLSPFSGSKNPWYKVWPIERWLELTRHLTASRDEPVYVLGARDEDAGRFAGASARPLIGLPLPTLLQLMREAVLFVSIDNGLSHLAHFGSVPRHLLIYPALLPQHLVVNPRAQVLRGRPQDISEAHVISLAEAMIGGPRSADRPREHDLAAAGG